MKSRGHRPTSQGKEGQNICSHAEITIQGAKISNFLSDSAPHLLCDLGLAASPLCALASSSIHWEGFSR